MNDIDVSNLPDPKDLARRHSITLLDDIRLLGVEFYRSPARNDGMTVTFDIASSDRRDTVTIHGEHDDAIMRDIIVSAIALTVFTRLAHARASGPQETGHPDAERIEWLATTTDPVTCWIRDYGLEMLVPANELRQLAADGLDAAQIAERLTAPQYEVVLHARLLNITI